MASTANDDSRTVVQPNLKYSFESHPTVEAFTVSAQTYLAENVQVSTVEDSSSSSSSTPASFVCVGAMVFHPHPHPNSTSTPTPRILLIQRAATDYVPNRWEIPGGSSEPTDPSILHSVAREVFEETGLVTTAIGPQVGAGYPIPLGKGKTVMKFSFVVEVVGSGVSCSEVVLDPREHQDYVWATEEEVRAGRAGGRELEVTFPEQKAAILEAFSVKMACAGGGGSVGQGVN